MAITFFQACSTRHSCWIEIWGKWYILHLWSDLQFASYFYECFDSWPYTIQERQVGHPFNPWWWGLSSPFYRWGYRGSGLLIVFPPGYKTSKWQGWVLNPGLLNASSKFSNNMVLLLEKHNNNFVGFVKQKKTTTCHDNNHHKGLELFRADAICVYWCVTCWNATGVSSAQTPSTQASLRWANIVTTHQAHRSANIKHLPGLGSMNEWAKPLGCGHVTPSIKH